MALRTSSPISHLLHQLLPPPTTIAVASSFRLPNPFRQLSISPSYIIPLSTQLSIPTFLSDIWESILRAVPKKKTSYRKKRQRMLAGKALKDVENLNKCPACGRVKKAHLLCPHCVNDIREMWKNQKEVPVEPGEEGGSGDNARQNT